MKYFSINELSRSITASRLFIDNTPPADVVARLNALVVAVLDPLREAYGHPITVNSGYRSARLNAAVGGVASSQHLRGEAADIDVNSRSGNKWLFDYIRCNLPFDQLIHEKGSIADGPDWVHVSYRADGRNRRQIIYS